MADDVKPKQMPSVYKTYKGTLLNSTCEIELIQKMEIRDDDIFVVSYPRSGTTLVQELTYLVRTEDFETAKRTQLDDRFPVIDITTDAGPFYRGVKYLEDLPRSSTRFIKTHLHYFLLSDDLRKGKGKVIYIARNPKDAVPSLYNLLRHLGVEKQDGTLEDFATEVLKGGGCNGNPWWTHVKTAWKHRHDDNFLFLKFEDVTSDKAGAARQIASFLGKSLSEETIERIVEHCSLENMKNNDCVNLSYLQDHLTTDNSYGSLINTGRTGTWRQCLSTELSKKFDDMIERELEGTGLHLAD